MKELEAIIASSLLWVFTKTDNVIGLTTEDASFGESNRFTTGDGVDEADILYRRQFEVIDPNQDVDIDLQGSLVDQFNDPLDFWRVKGILIVNRSEVDGADLAIGPLGRTHGWDGPFYPSTGSVRIGPGGVFCMAAPIGGYYTWPDRHAFRIRKAGTANVTFDLIIFGVYGPPEELSSASSSSSTSLSSSSMSSSSQSSQSESSQSFSSMSSSSQSSQSESSQSFIQFMDGVEVRNSGVADCNGDYVPTAYEFEPNVFGFYNGKPVYHKFVNPDYYLWYDHKRNGFNLSYWVVSTWPGTFDSGWLEKECIEGWPNPKRHPLSNHNVDQGWSGRGDWEGHGANMDVVDLDVSSGSSASSLSSSSLSSMSSVSDASSTSFSSTSFSSSSMHDSSVSSVSSSSSTSFSSTSSSQMDSVHGAYLVATGPWAGDYYLGGIYNGRPYYVESPHGYILWWSSSGMRWHFAQSALGGYEGPYSAQGANVDPGRTTWNAGSVSWTN